MRALSQPTVSWQSWWALNTHRPPRTLPSPSMRRLFTTLALSLFSFAMSMIVFAIQDA
ncbi:hypothetical protein VARIO8X_60549 [Burkholderiales bacterium 8X]|nr:hypothetical protein VARIO8X_60549 [Burkholderiales bacterium 8X]